MSAVPAGNRRPLSRSGPAPVRVGAGADHDRQASATATSSAATEGAGRRSRDGNPLALGSLDFSVKDGLLRLENCVLVEMCTNTGGARTACSRVRRTRNQPSPWLLSQ